MSPHSVSGKNESSLFSIFVTSLAGGWLIWWWLLFVLASVGHFSSSLVLLSLLIALGTSSYIGLRFIHKRHLALHLISKKTLWVTILLFAGTLAFLICVLSPLLASPTVFSGRDQGSYSLAAIQLAHTGKIPFDSHSIQAFFHLNGVGKALNFPGFAYDAAGSLVPQFPLGTIVWYAGFVSLFGLAGLYIANVVSATLSILFFFFLLKLFLPFRWSVFGAGLFLISFPLLWFGRFTLSETFALPLFLFLCLQAIQFLARPSRIQCTLALLTALTLAITRIEGWAIFAMLLLLFAFTPSVRHWFTEKFSRPTVTLTVTFITLVILWDIMLNLPFFRSIASTLWHQWNEPTTAALSSSSSFFPSLQALWQTLWLYQLVPVFVMGDLSVLLLIKKRAWITLVPLLLALPTLIYLFNPHISDDHPWMLRRFVFTLWPVFLFLTLLGIAELHSFFQRHHPHRHFSRLFAPFILSILTLSFLTVTLYFLPATENPSLLTGTAPLASQFTDRDLILVDRLASGNPYAILAGPLHSIYGIQAVYFFNPSDLLRLDTRAFDHIYILAGTEQATRYTDFFKDSLTPVNSYSLETATFSQDTTPFAFPSFQSALVSGILFEYHAPSL
ncbi:MAG: hypothetical protein WCG84_00250 [Candidatus Moraniibacteriota bacterium]